MFVAPPVAPPSPLRRQLVIKSELLSGSSVAQWLVQQRLARE
jgi:hypothetical protein